MKYAIYDEYRKGFPYYKVQYWDSRQMAWHDIQRRFADPAAALLHGEGLGYKQIRVMVITREGRSVYGE